MRCPLLGGSLTKIFAFWTKHYVRYSRHVRYLGCSLLGDFTVVIKKCCLHLMRKVSNKTKVLKEKHLADLCHKKRIVLCKEELFYA